MNHHVIFLIRYNMDSSLKREVVKFMQSPFQVDLISEAP